MVKRVNKPVSFYFNSVLIIVAVVVIGFFLFSPSAGGNINNYFFGASQTSSSSSALLQNQQSGTGSGSSGSGSSGDQPVSSDLGVTSGGSGGSNVVESSSSATADDFSQSQAGEATESSCNDGIYDIGESCDNGGVNGDGCSNTCNVEDGWVCFGFPGEISECIIDDSGSTQGEEEPSSGNPTLGDIGNQAESGGSGGSTECGDGTQVVPQEQCDDGNKITESCPYSFNQEACTVCSSACTLVAGTPRYCGDNIVNGNEGCDDGRDGCNTDGCTDACVLNAGNDECGGGGEAFFIPLFKNNFPFVFGTPHAVLSEENEVASNGLIIPVLIVIVLIVVWFARAKSGAMSVFFQ